MKATRTEVYVALNGERDYQDVRWNRKPGGDYERYEGLDDFLVYMTQYLQKAAASLTDLPEPQARQATLAYIRKITALGVACMEMHGAPQREGYER